jgi:integrase
MRSDMQSALRKRAGLVVNPHLFRHTITKIVTERDPGLYPAMSRHLGHKRIDMTMAHYLGSEMRASGRQIDKVLREALANPSLGPD